MKKLIAVFLAALLLCGSLTFGAGAADAQPSFRRSYYKVRYLSTTQLTYDADVPVRFEADRNLLGISVDETTGLVTSAFCLRKWGFVRVKMIGENGQTYDTALVEVDADMWQWMIIIFLFGWFWY